MKVNSDVVTYRAQSISSDIILLYKTKTCHKVKVINGRMQRVKINGLKYST